jgi:hypothetical protein
MTMLHIESGISHHHLNNMTVQMARSGNVVSRMW